VASLLLIIVAIDVGCYVTNKTGILMCLCVHVCKKQPASDKVKEAAALEEGKAKDSSKKEKEQEANRNALENDVNLSKDSAV